MFETKFSFKERSVFCEKTAKNLEKPKNIWYNLIGYVCPFEIIYHFVMFKRDDHGCKIQKEKA